MRLAGMGMFSLHSILFALLSRVEAAEEEAMDRDAGRDKGDPVPRLNDTVDAVCQVVDKDRLDLFQGEVELKCEIASRTPPGRDGYLGRGL